MEAHLLEVVEKRRTTPSSLWSQRRTLNRPQLTRAKNSAVFPRMKDSECQELMQFRAHLSSSKRRFI